MNELAAQIIDRMVEENKKKLRLIDELVDLSKKQELSLTSGSYNSLLDQIKLKQDIMDQIDQIDRDFYNDFVQLKTVLRVESIESIDKEAFPNILYLRNLVSSIMEKFSVLQAMDDKNEDNVKAEIERVKTEMKSLSHQVRANKVYAVQNKNDVPGFFVDSKK